MKSEVYSQSTCIVSTAAYQYYIEGKKRSEIAESLGLSPSTLSRVLKRAKEEGIIEIKVTEPFLSCNIMEKEIREKYGLKTVIVVPIPSELRRDSLKIKKQVALEGARYVQRIIKDNDVLGMAWGGTMYYLIQYLNPCRKVDANIITLHGSIAGCNKNLEVEPLVKRTSMAFGGRCETITIPGLCSEEKYAQQQKYLEQRGFLELFKKVDISVSGIGSLYPEMDSLLVKTDYLHVDDKKLLKEKRVCSDLMLRFIDQDGEECKTSLKDRTASISLEEYKQIPQKIIVASGEQKALSIRSALKGNLVDVLIIDYYLAQKLLEFEDRNI